MIGPGITIRGTVSGDEDLEVRGQIEGAVRLDGDLVVAKGAAVAATVDAGTVTVDGRIQGDVSAADGVDVNSGAVLVGNVETPRLVVAPGAFFKGRVSMEFDVPELEGARSGGRRR